MTDGSSNSPAGRVEAPARSNGVTGFRPAELAALLDKHRGEKHCVALQDYPDPDAISAAMAYKMIAERYDIQAEIIYSGTISHQENLALVRLLEIEMTRFSDDIKLADYDHSIFLDNQGTTTALTERLEAAGVSPLIIIDHHEVQGIIHAEYTDIRPMSATATMMAQYIQEGLVRLEEGREDSQRLATALMHGLRSETEGLVRARPDDFAAAAFLGRFVNEEMLRAVLRVNRSRAVMEVILTALSRRTINNGYSFAGIGYIRAEDRDAIPQAADFLLTEENVHTAVVYGIVTGAREAVIGSLRTSKLTLDVDFFLKDVFGADTRGRYYGGGRHGAGGFEIPIGFLQAADDDQQLQLKWQVYHRQIERMLMDKVGPLPSDRQKVAREAERGRDGNGTAPE